MGENRRDTESTDSPTLRREARVPLPGNHRPFVMVFVTLAVVFFAASLDAVLWQHSEQRRALRDHAAALEHVNGDLASELEATRTEVERLEGELDTAEGHIRMMHEYILRTEDEAARRCPFAREGQPSPH